MMSRTLTSCPAHTQEHSHSSCDSHSSRESHSSHHSHSSRSAQSTRFRRSRRVDIFLEGFSEQSLHVELFLVLGSTHGRDQHGWDQARQKRAGPLESRVQDAALSVDFCWEACCCFSLKFLARKQMARVQDEHDIHIGSGFVSPFQRCDDVGGNSVIPYDFAVLGEHCVCACMERLVLFVDLGPLSFCFHVAEILTFVSEA